MSFRSKDRAHVANDDGIRPEDQPYADRMFRLVDWANQAYHQPPTGTTQEDTVFVAGMLMAIRIQSRFGEEGPIPSEWMARMLYFGVIAMAFLDPAERPPPPLAIETWERFGEWLEKLYIGQSDPIRSPAVRRLFSEGLELTCGDVAALGDPIRSYAKAAGVRGGWSQVLREAHRQGVLTGTRSNDEELLEVLEAHRMALEKGTFSKTRTGRVIPNSGDALQSFLEEARPLRGTGREVPDEEVDIRHQLDALDGVERQRLVRRLHARIEDLPPRSTKSRSSRLIAEHRLALYRGEITPERIAARARVAPSPLHREWRRDQERIQADPGVVRLKRALGGLS